MRVPPDDAVWDGVVVITTLYFDPYRDESVEGKLRGESGVDELLQTVLAQSSGRGHSAVEFTRQDGSSLTIGSDGHLAVAIWINSLAESFHSVSDWRGAVLVDDYLGEAPGDWQVSIGEALECVGQFIRVGSPNTGRVLFTPD